MPFFDDNTPTRWTPHRAGAVGAVAAISLRLRQSTRAGADPEDETVRGDAPNDRRPPARQMLWVDGVGSYLMTLAEEVTVGRANPSGRAEALIPVLADLAGVHARVTRRDGRYLLTPFGGVSLGGEAIEGPTLWDPGVVAELGDPGLPGAVRMLLEKPHPLSATARLVVESGHRTDPAADAVLLVAESCVLGPKAHSHVRVREATGEAILFRGSGGLVCRSGGPLAVDGVTQSGPALLGGDSRVEGEDFVFTIEHLETP